MIPLLLKIKHGEHNPLFVRCSENGILFLNKQYNFSAIYDNDISPASLDRLTGLSCALVLIGPTGSGKTTTLKSIMTHCVVNNVSFTACEVIENKAFVDLLENGKTKKYSSSLPMNKQLKRIQLTPEAITQLFCNRKTSPTSSNTQSSRSCLIVTMYSEDGTVAVVDMMGNEKFDPANSNVFANSNVSSITQLLLAGNRTRSSNLVTNLIFQKLLLAKIKFILHLDQCGSSDLIKSSLYNIADVLKEVRVETSKSARNLTSLSSSVPHYAMPTASSLSPEKKFASKSFRPSRPKIVRVPLNRTKPIPEKLSVHRRPIRTITRTKDALYEVKLKELKEQNVDLVKTNGQLIIQAQESKETFTRSIVELKDSILSLKVKELLLLQTDLESIKHGFSQLEDQNKVLQTKLQDSLAAREEMERAKYTVESEMLQLTQVHQSKLADLQTAEEIVENLKTQMLQKNRDIDDLEITIQKLKESHSAALARKEIERKILSETAELQMGMLKLSQTNLQKQNHTIECLLQNHEKATLDLSIVRQELEKAQSTVMELKSQLSDTQSQLELRSQYEAEFEVKIRLNESSLEARREELKKVKAEFDILRTEYGMLKAENDTLSARNDTLKAEHGTLNSENDTLKRVHDALESEHATLQSEFNSLLNKFDALQSRFYTLQDEFDTLQDKFDCSKAELDAVVSEKTDIAQKYNDLVLHNKHIEEKYSAAMVEQDTIKSDEHAKALSTISDLEIQANKQKEQIANLRCQIKANENEIQELSMFKSKCANLDETIRKLRDESIEQTAYYEVEIAQLNSQLEELQNVHAENEELKKQLLTIRTPSPKKLFNPSTDIFEDTHKDYIKTVKQMMRHSSSPKTGILKENNVLTSDKKKVKRKSGLVTKSPKTPLRMST